MIKLGNAVMSINFNNLYICNITDKRNTGFSDHCYNQCLHSSFHEKDDCTFTEECDLHLSGKMVKVKCRKINKKEIKLLEERIK